MRLPYLIRTLVPLALALFTLLPAFGQTHAELTGKTLTLKIEGGVAPFATSGTQVLKLDSPATGQYTVDTNGARTSFGTYTYSTSNIGAKLDLQGYFATGPATIELYNFIAASGTGRFETYMNGVGSNNHGTYTLGDGSTGGATTAPVISGATSLTATVGQPFSYQVITDPVATSFQNMGGNATIQLNTLTGLVTGTFATAGTFTFSVQAINAAGTSATTTYTVVVTAGGTNGGGNTGNGGEKYAGRYLGKLGTRTGTTTNARFADYDVTIARDGTVTAAVAGAAQAFTGTVASNGIITFTGGAGRTQYGITQALVEGTTFMSSYGTAVSGVQYRFEWSTSFTPGGTPIVAAPEIGAVAGTYAGQQFFALGDAAATGLFGEFVATVTPGGVLTALAGTLTGRVDAQGNVTFDRGGANLAFGYTTGTIANGRLAAIGQVIVNNIVVATYRIDAPRSGTGTTTVATAAAAPSNLVGYRNRVGQTFELQVTGSGSGAVWGTDVYTDDSSVARAAVHAGVIAVGETKVLTLTVLPGRSSYVSSTRNGVTSASWGAWGGSYTFAAGGTAVTGTATAKPALALSGDTRPSTLSAGGRLVLPINVTGGGTYTYQWYLNGTAISGATANPYIVESVGAAHAGAYTVDVTNALGTSRLTAGTVTVTSVGAPVIALQPINRTVLPGGTFTLATNASGADNTYQWYRNGVALAGETGPILLRQNVTASDAGDYTVRISNAAGSVTSTAGAVTLSANASRPANLSVRANVAAGQSIIPGFFLQGVGTKRVIVRAVGSGLIPYGVTGVMANPKLEVYRGTTKVAESDDWDGAAATTAVFNSVGAFPLTAGSKDAALVTNLTAGVGYTVVVSGVGNTGGVVLTEVYDADAAGTSTSTITNASVRGQAGAGSSTLILGFVIAGEGSRSLLVRGVGPKLASYGVTGTLADPRLQIYDSSDRAVLANDDWGQADFVGELVQATDFLGTFRLDPGSKDAATLALLPPGAYTVHVSGPAGATGETLVEVYDVP